MTSEVSQPKSDRPGLLKNARLEARISQDQKAKFQYAADLSGRNLTEFVVNSVQEIADRTIREHEGMRLSRKDSEDFVAASRTASRIRDVAVDATMDDLFLQRAIYPMPSLVPVCAQPPIDIGRPWINKWRKIMRHAPGGADPPQAVGQVLVHTAARISSRPGGVFLRTPRAGSIFEDPGPPGHPPQYCRAVCPYQ